VVAEEPGIAKREARVLDVLAPVPLPTPRLLALDATGAAAGAPAVVMSRLAGRVLWEPPEVDRWLRGLVEALSPLHDAALPPDHGIDHFRPYPPERWKPPPWLRRPGLWDRALDVFRAAPLDSEKVLIDRDYHPGNVPWRRRKVRGVVDWQAGCIGPPWADVAWCRLNVLSRLGLEVADRLTMWWEQTTGRMYHPWAEVVLLVDVMGWSSVPEAQECDDLERTLARRLAELGA
jgi:aminoglycoside phosphotransferase (APT) family kinase protein